MGALKGCNRSGESVANIPNFKRKRIQRSVSRKRGTGRPSEVGKTCLTHDQRQDRAPLCWGLITAHPGTQRKEN